MATWASQIYLCRWKRRCFEQKSIICSRRFKSQRAKRWFDRETFLGLMRIRGMESNSPSGYAEAFLRRN